MITYFGVLSDAIGATICALVLLAALAVSSAALLPAPRTVRPLFFAGRSSRVCICGILSIQLLLKRSLLLISVAVLYSTLPHRYMYCVGRSMLFALTNINNAFDFP
jgi:hypothetical protein